MWGLSGIPCKHAICAINHQKKNRDDFVHEYYTVATFKKIYAATIFGINGKQLWEDSIFIPPLPPLMKRGRGHMGRRKEADEVNLKKTKLRRRQSTIKCRKCGGEGHNSVTCGRHQVCSPSGNTQPQLQSEMPIQEYEIPIQESQILSESGMFGAVTQIPTQTAKVPGPSMLSQLRQGQFILESQKKFQSLADIHNRSK
ncbi:uncharacterized protein LOC130999494 [Salvia miltiorrhiza]|uniref:uncharacterized protein LOC130999494 n=1 Tax=Salvia miltiorrhiza TaxID=226208 RepID=UPI0025ACC5D3|nr:uncharacterized protein LOC130999494 [Salvia miltiorrhiza]